MEDETVITIPADVETVVIINDELVVIIDD